MIKINALNAQKPIKKAFKNTIKPSMQNICQTSTKSWKTQPERISRRWLVTLWLEYLPSSIAQPVAIDSTFCVYDINTDTLTALLGKILHFWSFSGWIEYGGETRHVHSVYCFFCPAWTCQQVSLFSIRWQILSTKFVSAKYMPTQTLLKSILTACYTCYTQKRAGKGVISP